MIEQVVGNAHHAKARDANRDESKIYESIDWGETAKFLPACKIVLSRTVWYWISESLEPISNDGPRHMVIITRLRSSRSFGEVIQNSAYRRRQSHIARCGIVRFMKVVFVL